MKKHLIWVTAVVVFCVFLYSAKEAGCGLGIGSLIKKATVELKADVDEQKPASIIQVTPASLAFGSVGVGSSSDLTFTVTNIGVGTLSGSASGLSAPFSFVGGASYSLGASQSATITVRFTPTSVVYSPGTVTFTGGGGASRSVSGTGTSDIIQVTPASLAFGSVGVGSSSDLTFTVTNIGVGTLSGSASGLSAPFSFAGSASYSLGASQSATITVRFSPTSAVYSLGTVTFTGGGGASRPVNGTGAADVPVPPSGLSGTTPGSHNNAYTYSVSPNNDPDGDNIQFGWDWDGNGTVDEWSVSVASGSTDSRPHTWSSPGTYNVQVRVRDQHGTDSNWSSALTVSMVNDAPSTPDGPSGQTHARVGNNYTYTTSATDSNNDITQYGWDWNGDGVVDEWTSSGSCSHVWTSVGIRHIFVKAKDEHGAMSGWSGGYWVTVYDIATLYPTADAWVAPTDGTNYGNLDYFVVGNLGSFASLAYIQFSLSSIPGAATEIEGAYLNLYQYANNGGPNVSLGIHNVPSAWNEYTINGNNYSYYNNAIVQQDISNAISTWQWCITSLVSGWFTGAYPNYGLVVMPENSNSNFFYWRSREAGSNRPYLTVIYH